MREGRPVARAALERFTRRPGLPLLWTLHARGWMLSLQSLTKAAAPVGERAAAVVAVFVQPLSTRPQPLAASRGARDCPSSLLNAHSPLRGGHTSELGLARRASEVVFFCRAVGLMRFNATAEINVIGCDARHFRLFKIASALMQPSQAARVAAHARRLFHIASRLVSCPAWTNLCLASVA